MVEAAGTDIRDSNLPTIRNQVHVSSSFVVSLFDRVSRSLLSLDTPGDEPALLSTLSVCSEESTVTLVPDDSAYLHPVIAVTDSTGDDVSIGALVPLFSQRATTLLGATSWELWQRRQKRSIFSVGNRVSGGVVLFSSFL